MLQEVRFRDHCFKRKKKHFQNKYNYDGQKINFIFIKKRKRKRQKIILRERNPIAKTMVSSSD